MDNIKDKIKNNLLAEQNYRVYSKSYPKLYDSLYSLIDKLKDPSDLDDLKVILRFIHMKLDGLTKRSDEMEEAMEDMAKEIEKE